MTTTTFVLSFNSATRNALASDEVPSSDRQNPSLQDSKLYTGMTYLVYFVLQFPFLTLGIGTNILNIVVFTMSGQRDSVTVAFTALSISDLGYVLVFMILRILALLNKVFQVQSKIHLGWLNVYVSYFAVFFQDVSVVITVFVAIQKCCCVAIPHLFRNVFSTERTVVIMVTLSGSVVLTYVPILAGMSFAESPVSIFTNETVITVVISSLSSRGMLFWRVFNKIVLPASSQGITIICLIIMTVKLKKSANFRSSTATVDNDDCSSSNKDKNSSSKLGHKERRAVTAVALVSAIFVVSTLPAAMLSYAKLLAGGFFSDRSNAKLIRLLENSQNIPVHFSASVNMFIYLKYNTRYKETFVDLFKGCFCRGVVERNAEKKG